jgi:hypothetical protein
MAVMRPLLLLGVALAAPGCGGLYSGTDGGNGGGHGGTGLGPPVCMRTFTDGIQRTGPTGTNALTDVMAMAFDKDRRLHVLNWAGSQSFIAVTQPPPGTGWDGVYGQGHLEDPRDFAIDAAGTVYVLDDPQPGDPVVKRFDSKGVYLDSFVADAMGAEDTGNAIAIDGAGKLNVGGIQRLYQYELNGTFIKRYGVPGKGVGKVMWPRDLAWDRKSNTLWVADLFQNFVEQFTPGVDSQVNQFGGRGTENGKFDGNEPTGTTFYGPNRSEVDAEGNLYASDPFASRLQKLSPTGAFLGQFTFGTSKLFNGIAIDPSTGILYAARGATIDVICPF